ncbi:N-alpha-acetyltransferase 30 [Eublepharis macularius]|uniref:N-alpha-acetyltransferase 30 n=1 Tax=Eublepharis macularius TaxID=481883 RepID=A0AA97KSY6_EUBMA|nr:N-alpha-acetyltransferase 30 [Eublepharis macularius]
MAEVPPGPSSLYAPPPGDAASLLSPFAGATAEEEEEEEEEEEGGCGAQAGHEGEGKGDPPCRPLRRRPCPPHRRNHQLNGLIAAPPDLRHLRTSLKGKVLNDEGGKAMGHGRQQQQPQRDDGGQGSPPPPPPSSLSNHHRVPRPQARTAQPQQRPHHCPQAAAPSAGARNGVAGGEEEEEEEGEEQEGGGEEEESLLLLSRSLASSCNLQKGSTGPPTDSSWAPPEEEDATGDLTIRYVRYESELQMPDIMRLITKDLSEPYSIYTYRYFIHNWPQLCFLAMVGDECVGAIVCKLDMHKKMFRRGYIAMLAVDSKYRRKGIGTNLVKKAIYAMVEGDCDEVVLETEITNKSALKLYENLGFVRDKRLFRYYLNGVDALRLKLWLR